MEEEVLQLILRINEPDHGSQPDREEGEYITVRCMGASVPRALLRQQLVINSTVYVRGLLKMNRRQDVEMHKSETGDESSSKRMYAFPFIRVTPPFGCVQVLNNF
ncbi:hypothetical protein AGDE_15586 [Angomonas deanei]|nr:hypothetical protein AGDE_15586 [Angomonas deanei]|eukprot:EPY18803.1 hypothetical protein AGDE_15586 [Angomonas deanei]